MRIYQNHEAFQGWGTFDRSSNHVLQERLVAPDHSPNIVESEKPLRSCSSASTYHGKVMLHCRILPSCMQDTDSKLALILISFGEGAWLSPKLLNARFSTKPTGMKT